MNNKKISELFASGKIEDGSGALRDFTPTSISIDKANLIWDIIHKHQFKNTLEVGCAFGLSSLVICDAASTQKDCKHIIIDPFQKSQWNNTGIHNLKKMGFDFFELKEERSEFILPELLKQNKKIDFAFIDGWHTFDHTLIDFFYVNRMLAVGGVIVFDDCNWASIEKLLNYLKNYPCYKIYYPEFKEGMKTKFIRTLKRIARFKSSFFPRSIRREIFSETLSSNSLKLRSSIIAIQKVSEDERNYDWYEPF